MAAAEGESMTRLIESSSAQIRLQAARAFVEARAKHGDVVIVGASRGAADDLARRIAAESGATLGIHRFSVTQLAARLAAPILAAQELAPVTYLGSEAVAARATFDAERDNALTYFAPVARTPGFPRALARTLQELRLAQVDASPLPDLPLGGGDLAALLERFDQQFAEASATDRAALFEAATQAVLSSAETGSFRVPAEGLLLLDVPIESNVEFAFLRALVPAASVGGFGEAGSAPGTPHPAPSTLITIPVGDVAARERWESMGLTAELVEQPGDGDLVALRRHLFEPKPPPEREPAGDVHFFSAPGEGRECVEIARRLVQEARSGVRFDEMAVFLRAPQRYIGLLEHALNRAGVPAWFDRGTRRPHPGGRAFLAILACACEHLSARRFAEYLSLAQVPRLEERQRPLEFVMPEDEELALPGTSDLSIDTLTSDVEPRTSDSGPRTSDADDPDAIVDGSLRAPWKWETLIVESAVIGGDPRRWHRRLAGLANELRLQRDTERREDPDSARVARIERDLRNVSHLRAFALPIIDRLATWPK